MASTAGQLIRAARLEAGITQRQLAMRMRSTQPAIARLEADRGNPTLATVADALHAAGKRLRLEADPDERHLDESLIRKQLELTPEQRIQSLEQMYSWARELARAGERARGEVD